MLCKNCGANIENGEKFCSNCGSPVRIAVSDAQYNHVTPNIILCQDGKYRWVYELNLIKNPTVFFLIWKIFFFIFLAIFCLTMIADTLNGYMSIERFWDNIRILAYVFIGITVVTGISYLIYAAIMGGKYCVMFEMDDFSINHKQMPHQLKKAQVLASLTTLAGAASGNLSAAAIGISSTRTDFVSDFSRVKRVRSFPRKNLIKLDEPFCHNQVYAADEDFEFVRTFIFDHCTGAKKS